MPSLKINEEEMNYEELGNGDEVFIYINPIRARGGTGEEFTSLFPPNYRIILLELPTYEHCMHLKEFKVMKQWGEDVYSFSRQLGLDKFIYMGISRWGEVGYNLVLSHPEVIKGFIPIVSVPIPTEQQLGAGVIESLESGDIEAHMAASEKDMFCPTTDKKRLERREAWRKNRLQRSFDYSVEKHLIDHIAESRMETFHHLGEIKVPTLLLFGDKDPTNPIEQVINSAMMIPRAKAVFFQDYAHLITVDCPEKVVDAIVLFVNDLNKDS